MIRVNSMDEILALAVLFSVKRPGWRDDYLCYMSLKQLKEDVTSIESKLKDQLQLLINDKMFKIAKG